VSGTPDSFRSMMRKYVQRLRQPFVALAHDTFMALVAFLLSMWFATELRYNLDLTSFIPPEALAQALGSFGVMAAVVFWLMGLYRGIWRYASISDMIAIVRAVSVLVLVYLGAMFMVTRLDFVPRSSLVIVWFLLIFFLAGPRLLYRWLKDRSHFTIFDRSGEQALPVLLVGFGDGAEIFIREMARERNPDFKVLGVIDEKGYRIGQRLHGVQVLGDLKDIPSLLEKLKQRKRAVQKFILTKEDFDPQLLRQLLDIAERQGLSLNRLPRLTELKHGESASRFEPRPIAIEDLLGRPQTVLDRDGMRDMIAGRCILVTGAGGSIGQELVRQLASFHPEQLILVDHSEYALYAIDLELQESFPDLQKEAVLASIRIASRLDSIFEQYRPDLVFHAAALKHVPMVEMNPTEGVITNVIGSRNVADACRKYGVQAMIMISTDKAINPTNIMGATKRLAESYCQALDVEEAAKTHLSSQDEDQPVPQSTRFMTVRFGNVLGSTGSVVPLFQRQLERGGPLTVTHPDVTRYFMTIREAVELVLQASVLGLHGRRGRAAPEGGYRGRIFVLDMGKPVKITDLAVKMIRLAGLRPHEDVEIAYTGLRPGEKLFEELFHGGEPVLPTAHKEIFLGTPRLSPLASLTENLKKLEDLARADEKEATIALLGDLVPEYAPPHHDRPHDRQKESKEPVVIAPSR